MPFCEDSMRTENALMRWHRGDSLRRQNDALYVGDSWKAATVGARTVGVSNQNLEDLSLPFTTHFEFCE